MARSDERIPTWVGRAVSTGELDEHGEPGEPGDVEVRGTMPADVPEPVVVAEREERPSSRLLPLFGALGAVAVVLGLAYALGLIDRPTEASSLSEATAPAAGDATPDDSQETVADTTHTSASEPAEVTPDLEADSAVADTEANPSDADPMSLPLEVAVVDAYTARAEAGGELAWALYRDGVMYLHGEVHSQAFADELKAETARMIPLAVNFVEEYEVLPGAQAPVDPPLFLRESVLFDAGTANLQVASERFLSAVPFAVANFFPEATLTIVSYVETPEVSAAATALAEGRAEVIISRWEKLGIDRAKMSVEVRPYEDAEAVGASGVEIAVRNLLGGAG